MATPSRIAIIAASALAGSLIALVPAAAAAADTSCMRSGVSSTNAQVDSMRVTHPRVRYHLRTRKTHHRHRVNVHGHTRVPFRASGRVHAEATYLLCADGVAYTGIGSTDERMTAAATRRSKAHRHARAGKRISRHRIHRMHRTVRKAVWRKAHRPAVRRLRARLARKATRAAEQAAYQQAVAAQEAATTAPGTDPTDPGDPGTPTDPGTGDPTDPGAGDPTTSPAPTWTPTTWEDHVNQDFVDLVNAERARKGLDPVKWQHVFDAKTKAWAQKEAPLWQTWGNPTSPHDPDAIDAGMTDPRCTTPFLATEIIGGAAQLDDPQAVAQSAFDGFKGSPGHYGAMMWDRATIISVGIGYPHDDSGLVILDARIRDGSCDPSVP